MTVTEYAYAKINRYLNITGKRTDGFHDLVSVMQTVDFFDTVTLTAERSDATAVSMTAQGADALPPDETNLCVRAARAYLFYVREPVSVTIRLQKRIPMQAGFGGGSADAAAVLRGLSRLLHAVDSDTLLSVAASLGADVPFCLLGGKCICRGKGEKMSPCASTADTVLIVSSGEAVSTPAAFRALDKEYSDFDGSVRYRRENGEYPPYNVFESVVLPTAPRAAQAIAILKDMQSREAMMSGSGSGVYAVFDNEDEGLKAKEKLLSLGYFAALCHGTGPLFEMV